MIARQQYKITYCFVRSSTIELQCTRMYTSF